ncbi:MAG: hypothetical protein HZA59_03800 [Hydrogenophilales bacterium]|nr:hypothetical protein [Hydrogenophilales bacterium]
MRRLPPRPELRLITKKKLVKETMAIAQSQDPKTEAERRYGNARKTKWFKPIVEKLAEMSGPGERCMFCSGSESSQVEHFRPKAIFHNEAMKWENFLWVCGICNHSKSARFPPDTEAGATIINPVTEDVWLFFFIDEFGNLTPRWRPELNAPDPRASKTIEILALDRDALQQSRQMRLVDLKEHIQDTLALYNQGQLATDILRVRCGNWLTLPFQPDVADYFLKGPGRDESPFAEFCAEAEC